MTVITELEGLTDIESYFKAAPAVTRRAARLSINKVLASTGLKMLRDEMYDQVNFPNGYLNGDRLRVSKRATENNLEGSIIARKRATSLARFVAPGTPIGSTPSKPTTIKVMVKNGKSAYLRSAWLVRLRKGASLTEDNYNVGLAVRVKAGDSIAGKFSKHTAWLNPEHTVALLYGPSVDQVFRDVAEDDGPKLLTMVADEFFRNFTRLA